MISFSLFTETMFRAVISLFLVALIRYLFGNDMAGWSILWWMMFTTALVVEIDND